MACVYLITWFIDWVHPALFLKFDAFLGFFPNIFNAIFKKSIDFGYRQIPIGYVLTSFSCVLINILGGRFAKHLVETKKKEVEAEQRRKFIVEAQNKKAKQQQVTKQAQYKEVFFGLFEINLEYFDSYGKNLEELEELKGEYYKLIVEKLETKYKKIKFTIKNRIFFFSSNYSLLNTVT